MADDKIPDNYQSENEDGTAKEEDDHIGPSVSSSVSPQKTTAPHGLISTPSTEHSPAGPLQGGQFVGELPVRPAQYVTADMDTEHHSYVEDGNMAVTAQATLQSHGSMAMTDILAPHDTGRRPSLYNSPTEYSNPSGAGGLYNPNSWQTATSAPSATSMYANSFTQQQAHTPQPPQGAFVHQPPVTMTQGQPYIGAPFDGLPRYDHAAHGNVFRSAMLPHSPGPQPQAYQAYMHHDNRALPGANLKMDPHGRNTLH